MNGKKIRVRRHLDAWEGFGSEAGRQHVTFEDRFSRIGHSGLVATRAFDHGLEPDQHAKEFELHYIVNGEVNWWVKKVLYVTAGTALVIKPVNGMAVKPVHEPYDTIEGSHFGIRLTTG